jgi:UDP-glucuronate 4-epimerase
MKILVTGCAGFIGARTAELLLERGDEVVGVDNLNDYYDVRLKEYRLEKLRGARNFEFHAVDIEDRVKLAEIFAKHRFDAVINLAARAGVRASITSPRVYLTTNTLGTLNLLELMVEHGEQVYLNYGWHLSSAGHAYVAKRLARLLADWFDSRHVRHQAFVAGA